MQLQMGRWLSTWHLASNPQDPEQGSAHFWLMHASVGPHSEFNTHFGRQRGGAPMKLGRQEQAGLLPTIWHLALGPQGEGTHDAGSGDGVVLSFVMAVGIFITFLN